MTTIAHASDMVFVEASFELGERLMIVDTQFIAETVSAFHNAITSRENLCKTCQAEYSLDFYKKKAYQELYALRFLPAYYLEYCILAKDLYQRIKGHYSSVNIMSLGCGLSPDYYALSHNLLDIDFRYYGYDAIEWTSQKYMPAVGPNHQFSFKNIQFLTDPEISDIDVFFFPKSIGDIERGATGLVSTLGSRIAQLGRNRVFFLNSYVTKQFDNPQDKPLFQQIHNALLQNGYITKDDPAKSYYQHDGVTTDKPIGLRKIAYDFVYPNDKSVKCDDFDDGTPECKECMVPKKPILTNQYMSFAILEYQRQ